MTMERSSRCTGRISLGPRGKTSRSVRSSTSSICRISVIWCCNRPGGDWEGLADAEKDRHRACGDRRDIRHRCCLAASRLPGRAHHHHRGAAGRCVRQGDDFHQWDAWSPWAKLDPDARITFEGPDSGQGTVMTWVGNDKVGEGKMTLTESRPNDLVKLKVDFVTPFEGTVTQEFALKPQGDQTAV